MFLFFFFFSSRRRHTRYIGDWSSDVCSSDLEMRSDGSAMREWVASWGRGRARFRCRSSRRLGLRKVRSEERRVGKSVDVGGGRISKKKKRKRKEKTVGLKRRE